MENEKEKSTLKEEISNIGQIIVGELESIGGILTGDATARAEGDLRADEAIIREKAAHSVNKAEED
jgi:hypothetical protein